MSVCHKTTKSGPNNIVYVILLPEIKHSYYVTCTADMCGSVVPHNKRYVDLTTGMPLIKFIPCIQFSIRFCKAHAFSCNIVFKGGL